MNFYRHLPQGLESRGFKKSSHDDCLFTNGEVVVILWVDDCMLYAKDTIVINVVIDSLKDEFLFEHEEDIAGFLGLKIQRNKDLGTVMLTQT